jgi:hypothetical protein
MKAVMSLTPVALLGILSSGVSTIPPVDDPRAGKIMMRGTIEEFG